MKNFKHPNVLGLVGLSFDANANPLVILPFMKNGDLRSFLLKRGSVCIFIILFFVVYSNNKQKREKVVEDTF